MTDHIESQEKQMARLNPNNEPGCSDHTHAEIIEAVMLHGLTVFSDSDNEIWVQGKAALKALVAERAEARRRADWLFKDCEEKHAELKDAEADRDRYAAALHETATARCLTGWGDMAATSPKCGCIVCRARAALKDTP